MKKEINSKSIVGNKFGDVIVLELVVVGLHSCHESVYNCICDVCGSKFQRNYQTLRRVPKHNRYCYGGLYNDIPWKYNYLCRYHNILKRCKDSKYYNGIECELSYHEYMNELIRLKKLNNISDLEMLSLTIDRVDNSDNYKVGNLRLVPMSTQVYNRRNKPNCLITNIDGIDIISNSVKLISEKYNLSIPAINNCLAGRSKSHDGYRFTKISEDEYYNIKSVTTNFTVVHMDY